jgi:3-oxoacyl-[acyl-carrier protein] reductase
MHDTGQSEFRLTGFEGKVAVVTGAGRMRSIGHAIARDLAQAGCDVALTGTDRSPETFPAEEQELGWRGVDSVVEEIRGFGRRAITKVMSVNDPAACEELGIDVLEAFGRVDILVNAAAAPRGIHHMPVVDLPIDIWHKVQGVNLNGTFYMSRIFAQHMVAGGRGGSIINISSISGKTLRATRTAYAAAKVGVHALTSGMAKELGKDRIRVNAICPGYILTSRLDIVPLDERTKMIANIPLGRAGLPEDISAMALFLASDQGAWISGQQWNVDGGQVTMH